MEHDYAKVCFRLTATGWKINDVYMLPVAEVFVLSRLERCETRNLRD